MQVDNSMCISFFKQYAESHPLHIFDRNQSQICTLLPKKTEKRNPFRFPIPAYATLSVPKGPYPSLYSPFPTPME